MKGFLQEYGIIMVVVSVVLGMLSFGKTAYAKGIQDAILGSANHIVETGENIAPKPTKASDIIDIEGTEYIVLEKQGDNQALVMTANSVGTRKFNSNQYRDDTNYNNSRYSNSEINKYLENEWYNSLSSTMKAAIQLTNIKQDSYTTYNDPDSKKEIDWLNYKTISRHAFLPSVSEIRKIVDLKNPDKVKSFLNGTSIWTRDSYCINDGIIEYLDARYGSLIICYTNNSRGMRPAFVIDLSKVDYKVAGHTDYK